MKKTDNLSDIQKLALTNVANRLKALRILKGYKNYEYLAYELNMSRSQYGTYENGANITIATLTKILNHLDTSIEEFFTMKID